MKFHPHTAEFDSQTRAGIVRAQEMLRPSTSYWTMKRIRSDAYAAARKVNADFGAILADEDIGTVHELTLALDLLGIRHSGPEWTPPHTR